MKKLTKNQVFALGFAKEGQISMKYILTHITTPILSMELDEATGAINRLGELYAPERLPVGIPYSGSTVDRQALNAWWSGRSIPASRSGLGKPFKPYHAEQIKLVTSFAWLDLAALRGIDDEFGEILAGSAFIDAARRDALCFGLRKRVELLGDYVRSRNLRHNDEPQR